jgi:simple sugar transport system substrate-binding protein
VKWLVVLCVVVLAGCGKVTEVRQGDLIVPSRGTPSARDVPDTQARGVRIARARIVFVTHGQASDPFWTIVRKGLSDAGKQTQVAVSYRAPDRSSISRMVTYLDEAIADRPDGLVVSLPDVAALGPSIRRAVRAGIPVITINSGAEAFKSLGVMAHVGQPEYRAGLESGKRMGRAGVKRALCVKQESGNSGLDERCRGFADGLRKFGARMRELSVPLQDPGVSQRRLGSAIAAARVDGILTLGPGGAEPAIAAVRASGMQGRVTLGTFDLSPDVLAAVRDGQMLFAVDQQPYLQGYLPVILLAEEARHGVFPGKGELIPTGPHFVTKEDAADVIRLSEEGIR